MRIGALAKILGTQPETIRYYEHEGLLPAPARTGGNYRDYGEQHHERLAFIRQCRTLGLSLADVRLLLSHKEAPTTACDEVNALIARYLDETSHRINELQLLQIELQSLRARCSSGRPSSLCGIIDSIERAAVSRCSVAVS